MYGYCLLFIYFCLLRTETVDCSRAQPDHEKHSGGAQRQGADSPRERPCRLPHSLLWSLLLVCLGGRLQADAEVRPLIIVEEYEALDAAIGILPALEAPLAVDYLCLEGAVHALGNGVVSRLVVLRHADPDTIFLQFVRIGITAVLYASVRVVDEPLQFVGRSLRDGHSQRFQRIFRLQRIGQAPAYDLTRVGIRYQVQIATAVHQVDVRNVTHPELIGMCGHKAPNEVLVLVVAVVRVRCMTRLRALLHQLEVPQQPKERIATWYPIAQEHTLRHQPQLVVTDARVHLTQLLHGIHDAPYTQQVLLITLALLVIGLFRTAKQSTAIRYRVARIAAQALYCLAPAFFRTLMPCSSITSMSVFRANTLS